MVGTATSHPAGNWNDLPENAKKYIERIEELIGHSIYLVSTGAKRDEYLLKE